MMVNVLQFKKKQSLFVLGFFFQDKTKTNSVLISLAILFSPNNYSEALPKRIHFSGKGFQ